MNEAQQVIAALLAFGVLAFFGGVAAWWHRHRETGHLRRHVSVHLSAAAATPSLGASGQPASPTATAVNRRIGRTSFARRLQEQLVRSGLGMSANHFMLGQVAAASVVFLGVRFVLHSQEEALGLILSLALAIPVFVLPPYALRILETRRVHAFEVQLAQAVDVMAGALQAGSSLPQAFEMVAREMPKPIGQEFGRLMKEVSFGVPIEEGLDHMLDRVHSTDLDMLVTSINIQYRIGGNLTHILKTIAHTIRERVRIRGEISILTAQARLSSYIISGMPVVVVLILMVVSPQYILKLFDPGITRVMLVGGIMGIISGYYVMRRIATIEV